MLWMIALVIRAAIFFAAGYFFHAHQAAIVAAARKIFVRAPSAH